MPGATFGRFCGRNSPPPQAPRRTGSNSPLPTGGHGNPGRRFPRSGAQPGWGRVRQARRLHTRQTNNLPRRFPPCCPPPCWRWKAQSNTSPATPSRCRELLRSTPTQATAGASRGAPRLVVSRESSMRPKMRNRPTEPRASCRLPGGTSPRPSSPQAVAQTPAREPRRFRAGKPAPNRPRHIPSRTDALRSGKSRERAKRRRGRHRRSPPGGRSGNGSSPRAETRAREAARGDWPAEAFARHARTLFPTPRSSPCKGASGRPNLRPRLSSPRPIGPSSAGTPCRPYCLRRSKSCPGWSPPVPKQRRATAKPRRSWRKAWAGTECGARSS